MKRTLAIICLILAVTLAGCSNSQTTDESITNTNTTVPEESTNNIIDNTEQIISAIDDALRGISLNEKYDKIYVKKRPL